MTSVCLASVKRFSGRSAVLITRGSGGGGRTTAIMGVATGIPTGTAGGPDGAGRGTASFTGKSATVLASMLASAGVPTDGISAYRELTAAGAAAAAAGVAGDPDISPIVRTLLFWVVLTIVC